MLKKYRILLIVALAALPVTAALYMYTSYRHCANIISAVRQQDYALLEKIASTGGSFDCVLTERGRAWYDGQFLDHTTPLIEAVRLRDTRAAAILIEGGADINLPVIGLPPLFFAMYPGSSPAQLRGVEFALPMIDLLINSGADPFATDDRGISMINHTIMLGRTHYFYKMVHQLVANNQFQLLEQHIDTLRTSAKNYSGLDFTHLQYVLQLNSVLTHPDTICSRFMMAILFDDVQTVASYLEADPTFASQHSENGWSPMAWAVINHSNGSLLYLMSLDIDDTDRFTSWGASPLLAAIQADNIEAAKILLVDDWVNKSDAQGITPLWVAASHRNSTIARLLIAAGADRSKGLSGNRTTNDFMAKWEKSGPDFPQ